MSPTQREVLEQAKVQEMRELAAEKEIDLAGATTREEIAEELVASTKVSAEEIKQRFGKGNGGNEGEQADVTQPTRVTRSPEALLDPALTEPGSLAKARADGRTSDPATRTEGTLAADVPPDLNEGPKQSDAGPTNYPFPPGGDVEVALAEPGSGEGEYRAALEVDDWVVLDGSHELVPDRLDGHIAYIVNAPSQAAPDVHDHPNAARTPVPDAGITVRTRDEVNATLVLPMDAFKAVGKGGRAAVLPFG